VTATAEALKPVIAAIAGLAPVARLIEIGSPRAGARRGDVGGLWSSSTSIVAGLVASSGRGRVVVVSPSAETAEAITLDLAQLFPELSVAHLPVAEAELGDGPELRANRSERLVALTSLLEPGDGALIVPGPVLLEDLPAADGPEWTVEKGRRLDRDELLATLSDHEFVRVPLVAAPGEVSVRGDIIDIYPWAAETPVRIELFDDEVEDLRRFEVDTQRSVQNLELVTLRLGSGSGQTRRFTELLSEQTTVLLFDPPHLRDRLVEVAFERQLAPREIDAVLKLLNRQAGADLYPLDLGQPECDVSLHAVQRKDSPVEQVLREWLDAGRSITLFHDSKGERDRLAASLIDRGLAGHERLNLAVGRVTAGFALPADGPVLVHHHELIGRRAVRRRRPGRIVATRAIDSLAELSPGNYVVHLLHGVAVFRGMKRLAREQGEEDFLVLEFADDTILYVPASRIDLVERFIGGDTSGPKLDRLGGKTWSKKKAKVARAVEDLAAQLLDMQARRAGGMGFSHQPDEAAQVAFESTFPYEDTPDQRTAWDDVRRDMESERPADRLIVGDVGFGKTEVAVRAAYKTVLAGKQAAVLVPTTILAEQHFDTFSHRMAEEPVRIEVLSRLRSGKKVTAMLADLSEGKVDILIGTHRLLSKDVTFADLGLVIVDEEQRFGVTHKERLKQLKASVDVVTLSATPIPRTLHMAMSGLRDISIIRTPPPGRLPVITRVAYDTDAIIRDAIRHELNRGGQVFILHNRVQSLERMLERIRQLVPHARAAFAHGQMGARELTRIVNEFAAGDIDTLVCTTIIESGIDIPRANTIIVTDSDRYGLADMHQLRGRVGRENRQAYALFLMPKGKLPKSTVDRLKAIEEYSSLNAGLTIALRDLELRGAGNLLGAEQSGHIMAVGYDTYCRLLRNAVAVASGKPAEKEPGEIEVDLGSIAFLPTEYVPDEPTRMALLRRLASAGKKKLVAIELELVDRFGPIPEPAAELILLFELRRLVRLAGVGSLLTDGLGGMVISVKDEGTFEQRNPFHPHEIYPITPTRIRVPWPEGIQTARQRLRNLIERFGAKRAATAAR
jgi:transcription-repair coupling factor (superfamily II helicase)